MVKSRTTLPPVISPVIDSIRRYTAQLGLTGGNGAPHAETDSERLAHIERLMESMQTMLDTQFKRMSEMQVAIDRLVPKRD
jgi:hypothetical protein